MKNLILFVLCIAQTVVCFSQSTSPINNGHINQLTNEDRFQYINPLDGRYVQLAGERYFYDSLYHVSELKTTKSLYTTQLKYRFDQVERTIQVKLENGKEMFIYEKDIVYCKLFIEDKTVILVPAPLPNGRKLTLTQVIYQSPRMQLLRDTRKYIFRVKSANLDGYSSEQVYDEVRKDYRYYLRNGDEGDFVEVKLTAKSFANILPHKRQQINLLFKAGEKKGGLSVSKLSQIMVELDKTEN